MANPNKKNVYRYHEYVDGSAVRRLQTVPNRHEDEQIIRRNEPKQNPKVKRAPGITLLSFLLLSISISATLYACVEYLKVQTGITSMEKQLVSLENEVIALENDNYFALNNINTALDLEYVFEVAVNDLGMVFPNNNMVITYDNVVSEYVRQYEKIPEVSVDDLLAKIIK